MSKRVLCSVTALICLSALGLAGSAAGQVCAPLDNGRLANVHYEGTALVFEPILEFREMVLTITGPCEDIVRTFGPKEQISFDIRDIQRVVDGQYNWQLRRVAADPGLEEELQSYRGSGKEDAVWWDYFQAGKIPAGPYVDSGAFSVVKGLIVDPTGVEERRTPVSSKAGAVAAGASSAAMPTAANGGGDNPLSTKDFVINDDLIVIGSTCVGFDCVNGEVFGFDTIRLKENNLRIQFNDTSGSSFPTNNWQIRANSSQSGGENFLGFMDQGANGDSESGTRVFGVEAGAGSNALFVESGGDAGFGTGNPILNLHVVDGDSPGLRLEQDGSSGFQPQVWDLAGNETNFFVRDVTSGSTLPFRIFPGSSSSSLVVRNSNVGVGTSSPSQKLHTVGRALITDGFHGSHDFHRTASGADTEIRFNNQVGTSRWFLHFDGSTPEDLFIYPNASTQDLILQTNEAGTALGRVGIGTNNPQGTLDVNGTIFLSGSQIHPDYVFEPDHELESIEEHASYMWEHKHLPAVGPGVHDEEGRGVIELGGKTMGMLEELEKAHIYIEQLHERLEFKGSQVEEIQRQNQELAERLARLEAAFQTNDR